MNQKKIILSDKIPQPIGPYSPAIAAGNLIFTSGQLGTLPENGQPASDEIRGQTRQAILNLQAVLEAAGSSLGQVVKTTVFLRDMNDFPAMNEIYAEFFGENSPARSAIQVARLPKDLAVEIEAIALTL